MSSPTGAQQDRAGDTGGRAELLPLEYRTPAAVEYNVRVPRDPLPRWAVITAGIVGTVVAAVRWRTGDWYAYVGDGPDRFAKFEFPLWFQLAESSIVGLLMSGALLIVMRLIRRLVRARRSG